MKKLLTLILFPLLVFSATLVADVKDGQITQHEQTRAEYEAILDEAERARQEAESARAGAIKVAEMARQTSKRLKAEKVREESERGRAHSEDLARERVVEEEELVRAREELGRTHRELREATREVARAHRDLSRADRGHQVIRHVNLGDRAVIGIVLGSREENGVEIIGISPDGPAERAGLKHGDVLVSIRGVDLKNNDEARQQMFEVVRETGDGEELAVVVERDGETWEFDVIAETREPRSWQSVIRIPEVEAIAEVSGTQHIIVERIEVPDIDEDALIERIAELSTTIRHIEIEEFSDLGSHAMREANVWFGMPHGLELAAINEGLGSYFKTDRGVLVINAREDNAYQLEAGDVILSVGSTAVNSPSDVMRALRDVDPGKEIELEIKRDRRDRQLSVVMPENRLGHR